MITAAAVLIVCVAPLPEQTVALYGGPEGARLGSLPRAAVDKAMDVGWDGKLVWVLRHVKSKPTVQSFTPQGEPVKRYDYPPNYLAYTRLFVLRGEVSAVSGRTEPFRHGLLLTFDTQTGRTREKSVSWSLDLDKKLLGAKAAAIRSTLLEADPSVELPLPRFDQQLGRYGSPQSNTVRLRDYPIAVGTVDHSQIAIDVDRGLVAAADSKLQLRVRVAQGWRTHSLEGKYGVGQSVHLAKRWAVFGTLRGGRDRVVQVRYSGKVASDVPGVFARPLPRYATEF